MDWVSNSDPFVYPERVEDFDCADTDVGSPVAPLDNSQHCVVLQRYDIAAQAQAQAQNPPPLTLDTDAKWDDWTSPNSIGTLGNSRNGFCIFFIPRAGVSDRMRAVGATVSEFTELPLTMERWEAVARAFFIPGHFYKVLSRQMTTVTSVPRSCKINVTGGGVQIVEDVWMHAAATNPKDGFPNGFAMAATHIASRCFTYAVMVGCSEQQIRKVTRLVTEWVDGTKHPLLALGICAELHLDRLDTLVTDRALAYSQLRIDLDRDKEAGTLSWDTIKRVRTTREVSRNVEEEVNTTRLQLAKAHKSSVGKLREDYKPTAPTLPAAFPPAPAPAPPAPAPPGPGQHQMPTLEELADTTDLFDERLQDILYRFEGLGAQCRVGVESISFSAEVIRSELARLEGEQAQRLANASANNTAYGTAFAFMAAIYLPTTAVATIFATPVFGWANDWKDWRFQPVMKTSDGDSGSADQPVFSGYAWIWLTLSVLLSVLTFAVFCIRVYLPMRRRQREEDAHGAGV